jgi:general secretion pathway protein A
MYNAYFGFSESPFENNLDQRFLFLSESHTEVLAALFYLVKEKKGLALVCGDVGTGKTMLIHRLLTLLPSQVHPISIPNPSFSHSDLIKFIAGSLGITDKKENILELVDHMKGALLAARQQGIDYLLIIDEAQQLSDENLEQIRLLSNIEIPEEKLLQILLVGQNELSQKLNCHAMRPLRQRININRFLSPLTQAESRDYMDHRLRKAGSSFLACFAENCAKVVYDLTGGFPRNINHLCDNALLICMTEGKKEVNRQILMKAWEALQTDTICVSQAPATPRRSRLPWRSAAACLASLVLGFALGQSGLSRQLLQRIHEAHFHLLAQGQTSSDLVSQQTNQTSSDIIRDIIPPKDATAVASSPATLEPSAPDPDSSQGVSSPIPQIAKATQAAPPAISPQVPEPQYSEPAPVAPKPEQTAPQAISPQVPEPQPSVESAPAAPSPEQTPPLFQTHQVTEEDGNLTRIVGKYYRENKDLAFAAVLLANPTITSENLIYAGQQLILPYMKNTDKIFSLPDGKYYAYYDKYLSDSSRQQALKHLKERQVRMVVRETQEPGVKVYRIFLGGYDQKADLQKAITLVAKK